MPPSCAAGAPSSSAPGVTLDTNFGTSGVWTPVESGKSIMLFASLVGSDGKGYVLATVETPMSMGMEVSRLYRLNSDGSNDSTWGTNGYVQVTGRFDRLIQGSDGSFILGGSVFLNNNSAPVLVRLTSAGAPDTSWGSGGTVSFPAPPSGSFQSVTEIAVGPSGSTYANVETGQCGQGPCSFTNSVVKLTSAGHRHQLRHQRGGGGIRSIHSVRFDRSLVCVELRLDHRHIDDDELRRERVCGRKFRKQWNTRTWRGDS